MRYSVKREIKKKIIEDHLDSIKAYFIKKNAICKMEDGVTQFEYLEIFHDKETKVNCLFNPECEHVEIYAEWSETDSRYEIDDLYNSILVNITQILMLGKNRYVIRVYGHYYLQRPILFKDTINWKYNTNIKNFIIEGRDSAYNIENITACPKEQIFLCDVEVNAYDISSARSIAYNAFMEFISMLSVLLDVGFAPLTSKENVLLLDVNDGNSGLQFVGTVGSNGLDDTELDVLVFDNMNGLVGIKESGELVYSNYLNVSINNSVLCYDENSEYLEKVFKDRMMDKYKRQYSKDAINGDITFCNSRIEVSSEVLSFYRKVRLFEEKKAENYKKFCNACKMYNHALYEGAEVPTIMIAYLVAAIESLSKMENKEEYMKNCSSDVERFVKFCNRYLGQEDEFVKYIYGKIRSGHFHAGEFYFFEYELNMNLAFQNIFFGMQDKYLKAKEVLRKVFINWINDNILQIS